MKITQDVRDYAAKVGVTEQAAIEAGMREKAQEFKQSGGKIYQEIGSTGSPESAADHHARGRERLTALFCLPSQQNWPLRAASSILGQRTVGRRVLNEKDQAHFALRVWPLPGIPR